MTKRGRKRSNPGAPKPPHFIEEWRQLRDMSQEELAAEAGMSPPAISQLETGESRPTLKTLEKLAKALRTKRGSLLDVDPSTPEGRARIALDEMDPTALERALRLERAARGDEP